MTTGGPDPALQRAREIVRRAHALEPSPSLLRVEARLRSGNASARELARLVEGSPALAARTLRMANSAFYSPVDPVVSLSRAVAILGDLVLRQLVLTSLVVARGAGRRSPRQALAAARLTADAARGAVVARRLAQLGRTVPPDEAFVAGLLHDLGHIYLLDVVGDSYAEYLLADATGSMVPEHEMEIAATTHQEVGAVFAYEWSLPPAISSVLLAHHVPTGPTLAGVVAATDVIVAHLTRPADDDEAAGAEVEVDDALDAVDVSRDAWDELLPAVRQEIQDLLEVFDTAS
jgi:HD-like signal output (HDOD) protein